MFEVAVTRNEFTDVSPAINLHSSNGKCDKFFQIFDFTDSLPGSNKFSTSGFIHLIADIIMIKRIRQKVEGFIRSSIKPLQQEQNAQFEQIGLINQYRLMKKLMTAGEMPGLTDVGFKVYSQFEEDGILLYIFSLIGTTNKRVVEICAGDGVECMAANLIVNHGWTGLLFDGNAELVQNGIKFYASNKSTWLHPPIFKHAWVTRENVNQLIEENGFHGEIDLLSLDMDGNDYHIMDVIDVIKPRVIICETHNVIPSHLALTVSYSAEFSRTEGSHPDFMGVSLLAMTKLLNKKGYRLIGSHRYGFNAIFLPAGVATDYFPEVSVESVHDNSYTRLRQKVWEELKHLPWVEV
jgi:hypothetical protein